MTGLRLNGSQTVKPEAGPPGLGVLYVRMAKLSKPRKREKQSKQEYRTHGVGANESHAECDAAISGADEE